MGCKRYYSYKPPFEHYEVTFHKNQENTKKLMLMTGTHNGKNLVKAIYERFRDKGSWADSYILKFCEEKGIKFEKQVWY